MRWIENYNSDPSKWCLIQWFGDWPLIDTNSKYLLKNNTSEVHNTFRKTRKLSSKKFRIHGLMPWVSGLKMLPKTHLNFKRSQILKTIWVNQVKWIPLRKKRFMLFLQFHYYNRQVFRLVPQSFESRKKFTSKTSCFFFNFFYIFIHQCSTLST